VCWLLMLQTTVGAAGNTVPPPLQGRLVTPTAPTENTARAAYFLVGCPPTVRAVQMLAAPTVWGGALLVSFSRSVFRL